MNRTYRWMAARYVRKQAKQLSAQLPGIRKAEDTECVHRARVASRRLRAALRVFRECFPAKPWKRWRKAIRRITQDLGDARDRDVQIEFLVKVLHDVHEPDYLPGIIRLLVQVECEREVLQPIVLKAARRLDRSGALGDLQDRAKKILEKGKKGKNGNGSSPALSRSALRHSRGHVLDRLGELMALEDSLSDSGDVERHHAMRIAAKRLRYTMEIVAPVFGTRLDGFIQVVKKVQTFLGDIHDCDVWVERLDEFAESQRQSILEQFGTENPFQRLVPGIEHLRDDRNRQRARLFDNLVEYWAGLTREGIWQQLEEVVAADAPSENEPPAHASPAAMPEHPPATASVESPAEPEVSSAVAEERAADEASSATTPEPAKTAAPPDETTPPREPSRGVPDSPAAYPHAAHPKRRVPAPLAR